MKLWPELQKQQHLGGMLNELRRLKVVGDVDYYMALFLLSEAKNPSQNLSLAVALTCRATHEGHVCLDLNELADSEIKPAEEQIVKLPKVDEWRSELLNSGVVGKPNAWQPLILDDNNRLYLHRYWEYEQRLAGVLLCREQKSPASVDERLLSEGLDNLFQTPQGQTTDWQKCAAASAILSNITIISGGPGTGKTSTVVRIVALLRQQPGGNNLRIGLAAPTGMAAARLQQSIRDSKSKLPLPQDQLDAIPEAASTLHRMLGIAHQGTGFKHHHDHPLLLDVLILDEASMVDVALMAKLLDALPMNARLILLGDRNQLSSVEAGSVLGDICSDCEGPDRDYASRLAQVTHQPVDCVPISTNGLSNRVALLHHSYRFSAESPIGRLANAINQGDAGSALKLLRRDDADDELAWLESEQQTIALGAAHFAGLFDQFKSGASVERLFEIMHSFRILCALREGPSGVKQLNQGITNRLKDMGYIQENKVWYIGRPVMLTRNDYQLNLYNGETGIVLPHPDQPEELAVAFTSSDGAIRWVSPSRLPYCETVYALTVHKSQGSEFQRVLLHLPKRDAPVLCRELIYTAVTRSKKQFSLVATESIFRMAITRCMRRHSGLADLLST
ncbi:MAG: exodeoxyribonuclease V subunit alpha [Candidatus Thiodiazotropha sp. L084R]